MDMKEWNESDTMSDEEMKKLMERIEESAEDIRVPASLEPEAVKERLRARKEYAHKRGRISVQRLANAAAVVVLVATLAGVGGYGSYMLKGIGQGSGFRMDAETASGGERENTSAAAQTLRKEKTVGGYHLASDYEEVYAALKTAPAGYVCVDEAEDMYFLESSAVNDGALPLTGVGNAGGDAANGDDGGFSKTNTQVEGVDESDFLKNDGSYLYLQSEDLVRIVDIRGEQMALVLELKPELEANDRICDLYVDGDRLLLIVEKREIEYGYWNRNRAVGVELRTYDITDRSAAGLLGTVRQDGSYHSSRKVGDYVYLFTRKSAFEDHIILDDMETETVGKGDTQAGEGAADPADYIPCVNGVMIPADCIYLQEDVSNELIVSSVDIRSPQNAVDSMVLLNNYASLYMGTDAIYLYTERYEWDERNESSSYTDIVKFSYRDGILNGVGSASVRGTIQDVFAISESSGVLRVLTTEWDWENGSENRLYLLDDRMQELGSLENIAKGEEIYAARYIGNLAYFITYHNTDPLFAVDISDPANPIMLGQLEISGFSDYLHPYGDGLLLGIGYETEPETSRRLGVKLVMFDISDPVNLRILDTVTLDGDDTSAAYYYKSVLADPARNLIGFELSDWRGSESALSYQLYSWLDGHFVRLMKEEVDAESCRDTSRIRGIYAGSRFYVVNQWYNGYQLRSYDMEGQYRKLGELTFGEKNGEWDTWIW